MSALELSRNGSMPAACDGVRSKGHCEIMLKSKLLTNVAVGAAALGLAGVGGYVARASAGPQGAVNAAPIPSAGVGAPVSFADIIQHVAPAVVSIEVEGKIGPQPISGPGGGFRSETPDGDDEDGGGLPPELRRFFQQGPERAQPTPMHGAGSGFFITADGYVVTNNHVVAGADKITVHTADDRTFKARVVGRDPATDLAVLKVEASGLPFVSFEERAKPRVGDWVVAVGNPFNLGGTATAGIVSALGRSNVSGSSYVDFMQIDAPINRGNSGGPTFDLEGRVVGVNTAIYSPSGGSVGIGFDIPADVVAQVSRQLISTGKVSRGYIGAMVQDVTPDIADSLGVAKGGALVAELTPGGPAEAAGLRPGDLIQKVDGEPIANASDLTRHVGRFHAGDTMKLEIRREGQVRQISVKSGAAAVGGRPGRQRSRPERAWSRGRRGRGPAGPAGRAGRARTRRAGGRRRRRLGCGGQGPAPWRCDRAHRPEPDPFAADLRTRHRPGPARRTQTGPRPRGPRRPAHLRAAGSRRGLGPERGSEEVSRPWAGA